jgi:hypothetical protein
MNKLSRQIIINVTICLIFLSFPVFSSPDFGTLSHMMEIAPFKRNFLSFVFLLLFFYLNYYVLIPKLYFRKKFIFYFVALACCYAIINHLPEVFIPDRFQGMPPPFPPPHRLPPDQMNFFFKYARSLIQFSAIFFLALYLRINRRLRNAEKEKLKAELSYLKAQINPHFLFNTLNSLYALTLEKSDDAPNAVLKLSGMMRYVVTESTNDFVALEKEINYISDYIELQRLRIADEPNLEYVVSGNPKGKHISPLVIIPFIENAFKYGVNAEEDWHISIKIAIADSTMTLEVINNQVEINFPEEPSEQGIENTKKRLDLVYPGEHDLTIDDNEKTFRVFLKIQLS